MIPKTNPKEEKVIEVISAPENVAAFRVAGTVTAEDYDKIIPTIEEKLSEHEEIGILADLTDLEDMTGDALRRDLQYGLSNLANSTASSVPQWCPKNSGSRQLPK
ncbi:STAS/SEC14 domain-containing protein [Mesorhizobium sp.]|uniref:STAS/SEC14 domain-containing protein n=1 Tax=Mesorhizobium sp. TaxID=1871066 RepID=UPI00257D4D67|nr:STAS/SEC14 domain-containing protein [Mesorhizobium sp.]